MKLRVLLGGAAAVSVALAVGVYVAVSALDLNDYRDRVEAEIETATGREVRVDGSIGLRLGLRPTIALENVRVANAPWGSRPQMARVERFGLQISLWSLLRGELDVHRMTLVGADLLLETDGAGQRNWVFREGGSQAFPRLREVVVERTRLSYRDGGPNDTHALAIERLTLSGEGGDEPLELDLEGSFRGESLRLAGNLDAPHTWQSGAPARLDLSGSLAGAEVTVVGAIADALARPRPDLAITLEGRSLAQLSGATLLPLPEQGPFSLSGRLSGGERHFSLDALVLSAGESDLAGDLELDFTGERPAVSGALSGQHLDISSLTAIEAGAESSRPSDAAASARARGESDWIFSDLPLPLAALRGVDLDLELSVGGFVLAPGIILTDLQTGLRLQEGRLDVEPFTAGLAEGNISGSLGYAAGEQPPRLTLALEGDDVDYGRLLATLGASDAVRGRANFNANLEGEGTSPRELAASLDGRIDLAGEEGRVENRALRLAGRGLSQFLTPWLRSEADLRLNCVVARFELNDGMATVEALLMDTDAVTLGGEGQVSLRDETLALRIVPAAKRTSVASLLVPVRVSGPILSPQVGPDPIGTARAGAMLLGTLINPLATIATLIAESELGGGNPCVQALEAAPAGDNAGSGQSGGALGGVETILEGLGQRIDRALGQD